MNGLTRVFLLAVALVGCHHPLEPWQEIDLSKAEKIEPSAQYVAWWSELETCSGLSGDVHAVAFYVVPNDSTIQVGSESYWGYWIKNGNKIVLAGAHAYSEKLVKHEEMHALLHSALHPPAYFNGPCGDLTYANEG
ncbi:MAG TPA: hypothetical protein DGB72_09120 [Gemmatimonadetes bacterium]|jgi:hypothetical protein|nr:hypothetical protein [Gemmatimonadota bacterium]